MEKEEAKLHLHRDGHRWSRSTADSSSTCSLCWDPTAPPKAAGGWDHPVVVAEETCFVIWLRDHEDDEACCRNRMRLVQLKGTTQGTGSTESSSGRGVKSARSRSIGAATGST